MCRLQRGTALAICLDLLLLALVVLPMPAIAASSSHVWTTDADWRSGQIGAGLVLVGTGEPARLELRRNDFPDWKLMEPATAPPERSTHCLVWTDVDNSFLLFGGWGAVMLNDTWTYDFTRDAWTQTATPVAPTPRAYPGCAYDPVANVVVLYGGLDLTVGWQSDTWWFDVGTRVWTQKKPLSSFPLSVVFPRLVYDARARRVLLIGASSGIWAYDTAENTWTERGMVPSRDLFAVAYDASADRTIHFGGGLGLTIFDETREYDYSANAWTQGGAGPEARAGHALVYRDAFHGVLLFGGVTWGGVYAQGTWLYDGAAHSWGRAPVGGTPWSRKELAMAHDPVDDATILFGGHVRTVGLLNDTWALARWYPVDEDQGWESGTVDTGCPSPAYGQIWFNQTSLTKPPDTRLRFQVATSASQGGPWTYRGPGGSPAAYYETEGQAIDSLHDGQQYVRVLAWLRTSNPRWTPRLEDLAVTWTCPPGAPYIADTNPADAETGHPTTAPIQVGFSEPMDTATVGWTISGGITLADSWSDGDRTLELDPSPSFAPCAEYTVRITQGRSQAGLGLVPGPVPNPWTFVTFCPSPYILFTEPADGAVDVTPYATVLVAFSEPMDGPTVSWAINGGIAFTPSWDETVSVLTLYHNTTPFRDSVAYTVTISGRNRAGLDLVPGPVPNPWTFTAERVNPYIVATDPVADETDVPIDRVIAVTFSEAMNTTTVTWTVMPDVNVTGSWNAARTVLSLAPDSSLVPCAPNVVQITSGKDESGLPLVSGPVRNPWMFMTSCEPPEAAPNLGVALAGQDVILVWGPVPGGVVYNVYESQDRFAAFPSSWTLVGSPASSPFPLPGHGADNLTHFYVVRASNGREEGPNSTMGVKVALRFFRNPASTDVAWFSLPYVSIYARASDIARELGPGRVDVIGKWVPAEQRCVVYYFARGKWRGTDFSIAAGDGLYFGVKQDFAWPVAGTDANVTLSFTRNPPPKGNVNWVGIPYTGVYGRASDLSDELTSSKISEVGLWDAATQSVVRWYWTGSTWTGTDFAFAPGSGIYVVIVADFAWTPRPLTPYVP